MHKVYVREGGGQITRSRGKGEYLEKTKIPCQGLNGYGRRVPPVGGWGWGWQAVELFGNCPARI